VGGFARRPERLPPGFVPIQGDYTVSVASAVAFAPDYIVFTPTPAGRDADGYVRGYAESAERIVDSGLLATVKRAIYVSSTRVYAEQEGGVVTEDAPLSSTDPGALAIQRGEQAFAGGGTSTALRASGLYGDTDGMLLNQVVSGYYAEDGQRWSNRIHRDDLAGLICHLLRREERGEHVPPVLIASDSAPTLISEVEQWLASQLGLTLDKPRSSIPRANRQCSNALALSLDYCFRYPSFKEGYAQALENQRAK
jgi:nucleoside-diphosphate-sugar epimerase